MNFSLLPTRKMWQRWTQPSRYSYLGCLLGLLSVALTVGFGVNSCWVQSRIPLNSDRQHRVVQGEEASSAPVTEERDPDSYNDSVPSRQKQSKQPPPDATPEIYVSDLEAGWVFEEERSPISAAEFFEQLWDDSKTALQKYDFGNAHIGKRVTWRVSIEDVVGVREGPIQVISPVRSPFLTLLYLRFDEAQRDSLAALKRGDVCVVSCVLRNWDAQMAGLDKCVLLRTIRSD